MNRMSKQQKINSAKTRMEDAGLQLISFAEGYPTNGNQVSYKRAELLGLARSYAAKVDILTRVRK